MAEAVAEKEEKKLNMDVSAEKAGPCRKKVRVKIAPEEVDRNYDEQLKMLAKNVSLPGFRTGKVPIPLIVKKFSDTIGPEIRQHVVSTAYQQWIDEEGSDPYGMPTLKIDDIKFEKGTECEFEFEQEFLPKLELKPEDYKGVKVEKRKAEVMDKDIESELETLRRYRSKVEPVADADAAVAEDDWITIKARFKKDDEVLFEVDETEVTARTMRVGPFIVSRFRDDVKGVAKGRELEFELTLPEDFGVEELRGKTGKLFVEIVEIKREVPPALDDEFAKTYGAESLDDLKRQIGENLKRRLEQIVDAELDCAIMDKIVENVKLELPETMVTRESASLARRREMELMQQGRARDEIEAELKNYESSAQAAKNCKGYFILEKIAELENIKASDSEINERIAGYARMQGVKPLRLRLRLEKDGGIDQLKAAIEDDKIKQFLRVNAKVVEGDAKK